MHFHPLTIASVTADTDAAIRVRFDVPNALRARFSFRPGQHLTLRATLGGEELRRTYSICSATHVRDLEVAIKRVDGGVFSNHANDTYRAGDVVDVMEPSGAFVLPVAEAGPRTCLGIAAGSGITPVFAMLLEVMEREPESRFVLLYGNRHVGSILFREELARLKDRHVDRIAILHLLSRSDDDEGSPLAGRIDEARLARLVPALTPVGGIAHAFVCGPSGMIDAALRGLSALGLPAERIHAERFHPGAPPSATPAGRTAPETIGAAATELVVKLDGARHTVRMGRDESIVEAALRAGIGVPYSCRAGMCCTCRARLVEGEVDMTANYSLEPWEIERGFVLSCQARPRSARVVVDYDPV